MDHFFHTKSLKSSVHFLYAEHLSIHMQHVGNALGPRMWLLAAVLGSGLRATPLGKESRQLVPGLLPTPHASGLC